MDYQVTCIIKPNVNSPHEHITHLGAQGWLLTRDQVIANINVGHRFYVVDPRNGKTAWVGVVTPVGRPPYLRTHADGDWNDNLLSLAQCPLR